MPPSKQAIEEYKEIYKKVFIEEISDQGTYNMASNLLRLFKAIYRPIPKDKEKEFKRFCNKKR